MIDWVRFPFFKRAWISNVCRPLIEFQETGTHSKVRDSCHVSIFPGWDVTIYWYQSCRFSKTFVSFSKSNGYRLYFRPCLVYFKIKYLSFKKTSEYSTPKRTRPTLKGACDGGGHPDTTYSCIMGGALALTQI